MSLSPDNFSRSQHIRKQVVATEAGVVASQHRRAADVGAAVLAAGYAPAVGFIHTGKPLSFVYDIADLVKFDSVVPVAFQIAARDPADPERTVRLACRDTFRKTKLLEKLIPLIEDVLSAGELEPPAPPEDAVGPAIPNPESLGDAGHRG